MSAVAPTPIPSPPNRTSGRRRLDILDDWLSVVSVAAAVGLLAVVAAGDPVRVGGDWLVIDRVGALWAVFAVAVGGAVRRFARRQLAGDPGRRRFQARSAVAILAGVLLFWAGNLAALLLGAVLTSVAAAGIVGTGPAPAAAVARRTRRTLIAADALLAAAVVLVVARTGEVSYAALDEVAADGGAVVHVAALAVVVAALVRCAQVPWHGWLARSLVAPTPASALLHAGLVNAGGVLLIRTAPMVAASMVAVVVGIAAAGLAMVLGAAVMRARPEVKTALVWSTIAQMGVMLAQALLGLGAAAAAHLVAHGAYKSHLFLASGSTLEHTPRPTAPVRWAHRVAAVGLAASVVVVAVMASGFDVGAHSGAAILVPLLAAVTVAVVLAGPVGLRLGSLVRRVLLVAVLAAAATAYLALLARLESWLALPDATPRGAGIAAGALAAGVLAGAVLTGAVHIPGLTVPARVRAHLEALARTPVVPAVAPVASVAAPATAPDGAAVESAPSRRLDAVDVEILVDLAARVVPPTWGLDHVVAVNPLNGLEDLPVEQAHRRAADLFGARAHLPAPLLAERIWRDGVAPVHLRAAAAQVRSHVGRDDAAGAAPAGDPRATTGGVADPGALVDPGALDAVDVPASDVPWSDVGRGPVAASAELRRRGTAHLAARVDALVSSRAAAHLGAGAPMADLYHEWRRLAAHDPEYRNPARRRAVAQLPARAVDAVAACLAARGVSAEEAREHLEAQLARVPGWTAAVRHLAGSDGVVALAATRLAVEHVLAHDAGAAPDADSTGHECGPVDERAAVWQAAAELAYADRLLARLDRAVPPPDGTRRAHTTADASTASTAPAPAVTPAAQVVCCIDVRSEPLRRHLEAIGPYETFGFAGFFGVPLELVPHDTGEPVASCPVIVEPRARVVERPDPSAPGPDLGPTGRDVTHRSFHAAERGGPAAFALADSAGWLLGLRTLVVGTAPETWYRLRDLASRVATRLRVRPAEPTTYWDLDQRDERAPGEPDGDPGDHGHDRDTATGLSVREQAALAHGALTAMGLTSGFAPIVVLCGHRSDNRNNPFRSSLDCGACGANPGGPNARVLAAICNRADVRAELSRLGVDVPADTWFVAAEHETTDDTVALLDADAIPERLHPARDALRAALELAGERARDERWSRLPGSPLATARSRRSHDPAQIVPDWGLAGCASIIIGSRDLTAGIDLGGRAFLHSYDTGSDPDGAILDAIMTGPVVVAHWISSQYYYSTVDPRRFGAGSKALHNVVGRIGVVEGADAELRIGLPLESCWFGGRPVHDPLRLLVVVDAPDERVEEVIGRNPVLRRMFDNGWARVAARTADGRFGLRGRLGEWLPTDEWWTVSGPTPVHHPAPDPVAS